MTTKKFEVATLNRGRYMLILLAGVCLISALVSQFPLLEIVKILIVLCSVPGIIFIAIQLSRNNSLWSMDDQQLRLTFKNKEEVFEIANIAYIRNVPRSGGNLIMIATSTKQGTKRYWRNKLFQKDDDLNQFLTAAKNNGIEYIYM